MNHELLKSVIYDQHELIQNANIVSRPSDVKIEVIPLMKFLLMK